MAITFDSAHKNKIGEQLTLRIAQGLEQKELSLDELPVVSDFILDQIDDIATHEQLVDFLKSLTAKWPIFQNSLTLEEGEETQLAEQTKISEVQKLIKENQIDAAITTAQSAA